MSRGRRASIRQLFGRRLRALRRLRGLTQEELGERSDVSGKLVGQIERGAGNPTLEVITGFAEALSVEPAALLQFEEDRAGGSVERAAGAFAGARAGRQVPREEAVGRGGEGAAPAGGRARRRGEAKDLTPLPNPLPASRGEGTGSLAERS